MVPVALGVTILAFFMIHLVPGDPARTMLGTRATDQSVAALHHRWGLDQPLPSQYVLFMERLGHGDLGDSLFYRVPTSTLILGRLPATLLLLAYAVVLSILIAVPLATLAATHKDRLVDRVIRAIPLVGLGMPSFWVGIMLILFIGLDFRLFPVGGYGEDLPGHLYSMFLPGLTVAIAISPLLIRSLRTSMLAILESEFVATARSKGISERRVLLRHVLRNAAIPAVTVLGVNIGFLVGGTLIVENVFARPGLGSALVQAVNNKDYPVVQGITLVLGFTVVVITLLVDVLIGIVDPRSLAKKA